MVVSKSISLIPRSVHTSTRAAHVTFIQFSNWAIAIRVHERRWSQPSQLNCQCKRCLCIDSISTSWASRVVLTSVVEVNSTVNADVLSALIQSIVQFDLQFNRQSNVTLSHFTVTLPPVITTFYGIVFDVRRVFMRQLNYVTTIRFDLKKVCLLGV